MFTRLRGHWPKISKGLLLAALVSAGATQIYDTYYGDCCQPGAACCHPGSPCCHHGERVAAR